MKSIQSNLKGGGIKCTERLVRSLSIVEAAGYSGIGQTKLRQLVSREDCPFALWVGRKCLIKRKQFDEYLNNAYSI